MNKFQEKVLKEFPQFSKNDFEYFVESSQDKVELLTLSKKCSINAAFMDANYEKYYRAEYCFKNCGFKCLRGISYKNLLDGNRMIVAKMQEKKINSLDNTELTRVFQDVANPSYCKKIAVLMRKSDMTIEEILNYKF